MESLKEKVRYRLIGPKVQVIKVEGGVEGIRIYTRFPDTTITMVWDTTIPRTKVDVRIGDLLTLATEVPANAEPAPSSVQ